ncbi:putative integral membrane protein [Babesia bovis T2Bo]|uniref:Uncharacterized protein n=1 Tax=Babesia bovis TaxID=5865 RepID=A7AWI7_BABBO|nr:putative integral membrane protein [Babesia bovis T2Bo]EDO05415.1 putative integral membrane protein [Babesia bovis T2Bo]BAN64368.1 hypothetical protein [Babesia bovis]|eukprot:XP_001608983.1 hypothetical protein [Babesia bovis T2Bo]
MEPSGNDSSYTREESRRLWPCSCAFLDGLCRSYGLDMTKVKSYSLLSLLLKSEALYLLHMCYISLLIASHPDGDKKFSNAVLYLLPSLWLLKPLFALIDDHSDLILRKCAQWCRRINGEVDTSRPPTGRSRSVMDSLVDLNKHANLMLCVSHIGIVTLLSAIMSYSKRHPLSGGCGPHLIVLVSLCQIASGAVSDGAFCRYVQCNSELSEVQFASLRLLFMIGYGLCNMLSVVMPFPRSTDFITCFMTLINLAPCFLLGNSVCVLWVLLCDPGEYEEAVDQSKRKRTIYSPKVAIAFLGLMYLAMAMRMPYDTLLLKASRRGAIPVMTLVGLSLATKIVVSTLMLRYCSLKRLLKIAKYIFVACIVVYCTGYKIPPLPSTTSSVWYLTFVAIQSTSLHQILLTFGIVMTVRCAPRGWEASVMSLGDLSFDLVIYLHRSKISPRKWLYKIIPSDIAIDICVVFFCLYCISVIFGNVHIAALLQNERNAAITTSELPLPIQVGEYPSASIANRAADIHEDGASSVLNAHECLDSHVDKSPWAADSEYSDGSNESSQ